MAKKAAILEPALAEIREFCADNSSEANAKRYARFFTEGYDAYGIPKEVWESNRSRFYHKYQDRLGLQDFLDLGDLLFGSGKYEEGSFAIVSVQEMLDVFTPETFQRVGMWLEHGVRNWAHSDVICGMLLGPCLKKGLVAIEDLSGWRASGSKWKRRAVPVSMLALLEGKRKPGAWLKFLQPLMLDRERVVHQGMGWFLREVWKQSPAPVEAFLLKWKDKAPRLIFQYATEKMTPSEKQRFRKAK